MGFAHLLRSLSDCGGPIVQSGVARLNRTYDPVFVTPTLNNWTQSNY